MYNWTLLLADMNMLGVSGTAFSEVLSLDSEKTPSPKKGGGGKKRHENVSSTMGKRQNKSLQN